MANIDARVGCIDLFKTNKLQVNNTGTYLQWGVKDTVFNFLNKKSTIINRTASASPISALGANGYVAGTGVDRWAYRVHVGGSIYVGIGNSDAVDDTNPDNYISVLLTVGTDDVIDFALSETRLEIIHNNITIRLNITALDGQIVYPLITANAGETISISIESTQTLCIYTNKDGIPVIDTTKLIGVSNQISIITGGGGVTIDGDLIVTSGGGGGGGTANKDIPIKQFSPGEIVFAQLESAVNPPDVYDNWTFSPVANTLLTTSVNTAYSDFYTRNGVDWSIGVASPAGNLFLAWSTIANIYIGVRFNAETTTIVNATTGFNDWVLDVAFPTWDMRISPARDMIEAFGNIYLTVNGGAGIDTIAYSADSGVTWPVATTPSLFAYKFAYKIDTVLVAVGVGGGPIYTTDGTTWLSSGSSNFMNGVCYSVECELFVATGNDRSSSLYTSADGITWVENSDVPWETEPLDIVWVSELGFFVLRTTGDVHEASVWISRNAVDWKGLYFAGLRSGFYSKYIPEWGMMFFSDDTNGGIRFTPKRFMQDTEFMFAP